MGTFIMEEDKIPFTREELICHCETGNLRDPFAVSVLKGATIVCRVHHRISVIYSMLLQLAVNIDCTVIESN